MDTNVIENTLEEVRDRIVNHMVMVNGESVVFKVYFGETYPKYYKLHNYETKEKILFSSNQGRFIITKHGLSIIRDKEVHSIGWYKIKDVEYREGNYSFNTKTNDKDDSFCLEEKLIWNSTGFIDKPIHDFLANAINIIVSSDE